MFRQLNKARSLWISLCVPVMISCGGLTRGPDAGDVLSEEVRKMDLIPIRPFADSWTAGSVFIVEGGVRHLYKSNFLPNDRVSSRNGLAQLPQNEYSVGIEALADFKVSVAQLAAQASASSTKNIWVRIMPVLLKEHSIYINDLEQYLRDPNTPQAIVDIFRGEGRYLITRALVAYDLRVNVETAGSKGGSASVDKGSVGRLSADAQSGSLGTSSLVIDNPVTIGVAVVNVQYFDMKGEEGRVRIRSIGELSTQERDSLLNALE